MPFIEFTDPDNPAHVMYINPDHIVSVIPMQDSFDRSFTIVKVTFSTGIKELTFPCESTEAAQRLIVQIASAGGVVNPNSAIKLHLKK